MENYKLLMYTKRCLLIDNLDIGLISSNLLQDNVLNGDQIEEIMAEKTRRKQVEKFLEMLPRLSKKMDAFDSLCKALIVSGYDYMETELREAASQQNIENHQQRKYPSSGK